MNIKEIASGIHYVGVNDRVTQRFESLWPLPYGVTYNSYLITDEKIALIDCVEISEVEDLLRNIRNISGSSVKLDYLVVNHMEPDHSGGIPILVDEFPDMKIVGNKLTIGMLKGFYHIDDDSKFYEVADGDVISLGSHSLRFIMTPMVHWPETMMTYVEDEKVLFSGDAFGTFGALNGAVVDEDMDTSLYFEEAYRYYSNIVGKYGTFVLRAAKKLENLEIGTICPTHGPVWRRQIPEILELYKRLASYESEPGVVIVYGSMYGNSGAMAEKVAEGLAARGVRKIIVHNAAFSELSYMIRDAFRYKGLVVISPTYQMTIYPPIKSFMEALKSREIRNKALALCGSFTWASGALPELKKYSQEMKHEVIAEVQMKHAPSGDTLAAVEALCDKMAEAAE